MKKIIILSIIMCMPVFLFSQGANWYMNDVEKALLDAKNSNKMIFVDVYTEWCSWCKKLDRETFVHNDFLKIAPNFILLKVDADRLPWFKGKYNIRAYPTLLFLDKNGVLIQKILGFKMVKDLLPVMEKMLQLHSQRGLEWFENSENALKKATEIDTVVFTDVFTENCSWCEKLVKETFTDPGFIEIASRIVLLKINAKVDYDFCSKYRVRAYPTLLFLDKKGNELERIKGFVTADELIPVIQDVLEKILKCSFSIK